MRLFLFLNYYHRIAKAEESIFLLNSSLVGVQNVLSSRKGGNQHNEGTLRKMEIGDQSVDHLEAVTRIDKDLGPAASGF